MGTDCESTIGRRGPDRKKIDRETVEKLNLFNGKKRGSAEVRRAFVNRGETNIGA
jgi:hypothetical protein